MMDEKLNTVLLEYEKSTFIIDLMKHNKGQMYVAIEQIIHGEPDRPEINRITINPFVLGDIIEVLTNFSKDTSKKNIIAKGYFSDEKQKEVVKRYFIGVDIKDLALQFDCSENVIRQIITTRE